MNQKSWFHSGILQGNRALSSAVYVFVVGRFGAKMQSEYMTLF